MKNMRNRIKKLLALIICISVSSIIASCSGSSYKTDLTAEELYSQISSQIQTEELNQMRDSAIPDQYGSSLDFVEDKVVYKCASGAAPDEIAVFKLNDENSAGQAEEVMNNRIEYQRTAFENYQPQEMYKFDNTFVKTYGVYTVMIIAEDVTQADSIISGILNN